MVKLLSYLGFNTFDWQDIESINKKLKEKEDLLAKQNQKLQAKEEKLTEYINKILEQQERERIVKWLVNSIRESLELDKVLSTTTEEVGKLIKADRCLIALFDGNTSAFNIQSEYKLNTDIPSFISKQSEIRISSHIYKHLIEDNKSIAIDDVNSLPKDFKDFDFPFHDTKSMIITPVAHKDEILGIIIIQQSRYKRKWNACNIEILEEIASQITIAIRQAYLYTRVQIITSLKSEFLANMSHEFRTPLNAIIGFSEMLLNTASGQLTSKQIHYLDNIAVSGKHLLHLVNDVLDLSKIESGNLQLNYEVFESSRVICDVVTTLRNMADKKNINIELNLSNIILNADILRFRQVIYNLISNAVKFTEDNGKITVTTSIANKMIRFEVEDTGIGIADENRDKIFEKFRQIDSSYARKQEGTGLGLSLVKKIIELHGGSIDFESEEGQGSKFWFTMPEAKMLGSSCN
jgi:signal transduction histidine kinase